MEGLPKLGAGLALMAGGLATAKAGPPKPMRRMAQIEMMQRMVSQGYAAEQDIDGKLQFRKRDEDEAPQPVHAGTREAQRRRKHAERQKLKALGEQGLL